MFAPLSYHGAGAGARGGAGYDPFDEAAIGADTSLSVFFEENGWVFAEFNSPLSWVRAWIPADQVEARQGLFAACGITAGGNGEPAASQPYANGLKPLREVPLG